MTSNACYYRCGNGAVGACVVLNLHDGTVLGTVCAVHAVVRGGTVFTRTLILISPMS